MVSQVAHSLLSPWSHSGSASLRVRVRGKPCPSSSLHSTPQTCLWECNWDWAGFSPRCGLIWAHSRLWRCKPSPLGCSLWSGAPVTGSLAGQWLILHQTLHAGSQRQRLSTPTVIKTLRIERFLEYDNYLAFDRKHFKLTISTYFSNAFVFVKLVELEEVAISLVLFQNDLIDLRCWAVLWDSAVGHARLSTCDS